MKRNYLFLVLPVIFVLTLFTGCHNKTKIGILMDNVSLERWKKDKELFEKQAGKLNADVIIKVAGSDADVQLNQAEELISDGVDVLIVIPVDQLKSKEIVKKAHAANIPVLSYDRMIKESNVDYYVSTDNISVGEMQADYLSKISPVGNYALITGPNTDNNAFLLHLGWLNVLQPYIDKGDIKVVIDEYTNFWLPDESYRIMKDYLADGGKIDAVLAGNDALAQGAIMALKEFDYDGKVLVAGQDADVSAIRNIVAGVQTITVYKPIESLVYAALNAAVKIANGEAPSNMNITVNNGKKLVPAILLKSQVVNRQNIKMTVISEGFITEQELK